VVQWRATPQAPARQGPRDGGGAERRLSDARDGRQRATRIRPTLEPSSWASPPTATMTSPRTTASSIDTVPSPGSGSDRQVQPFGLDQASAPSTASRPWSPAGTITLTPLAIGESVTGSGPHVAPSPDHQPTNAGQGAVQFEDDIPCATKPQRPGITLMAFALVAGSICEAVQVSPSADRRSDAGGDVPARA